MMNMDFENPYILIFGVGLPGILMILRVTLVDHPRMQLLVSSLMRCLIVLLLVLSLAGALWIRQSRDVSLLVVADLSDSVSETADEQVLEFLAELKSQMPKSMRAGLITFASSARSVSGLSDHPQFPESLDQDKADGVETCLEKALLYAMQQMPVDTLHRILLFSDGNETQGNALAVAQRGAAHGCEISCIPYRSEEKEEILLEDLIVPAEVKKGQSFGISAVARSVVDTSATFILYRDGFKVQEKELFLRAGSNTLTFQESKSGEGLTQYELHVRGGADFFADNNVASGIVHSVGEPRVLILERDEREARYLSRALEAENMRVEVREGKGMPTSLEEFAAYDAVILSDVAAPDISVQQMNLLRSYVEDLGGGFIMIGGEESFGLGGYYHTAIEEMLPVCMRSEKKKDTPSLALMLVIDKSGSMSGEKIELAKEAAIAAVELLSERDSVGVIAFDGDPYWVVELQNAGNTQEIVQRIAYVEAGGGTHIYLALVNANETLAFAQAVYKHVILLTDGVSQAGDFPGIVNEMVDQAITVSTVAVGEGADIQLLQDIARWGRGRYYFTSDAYDIPQIFSKETMTASKSSLIEESFLAQLYRPHSVVQSIDWETAPFLYGYVVTTPKATADVILLTERGDPLLAQWQFGLGKCVAFTSDAKSRWAADWISWEGYSKLWVQVIRWAMRASQNRGAETTITYRGNQGWMVIDQVDDRGDYVEGLDSILQMIKPDLSTESVLLSQSAPGRYEAEFPLTRTGSYLFKIRQTISPNSGLQAGTDENVYADFTRGLSISYKPEYRHLSTQTDFLRELAAVTGGRLNPTVEDLITVREEQSVPVHQRLWRWFLAAALLLFVLDVALRRFDFSGTRWVDGSVRRYG